MWGTGRGEARVWPDRARLCGSLALSGRVSRVPERACPRTAEWGPGRGTNGRRFPGDAKGNNKRLYCPTQSVLRTTQQVGTRAHLIDGETEAQPCLRSCSWFEVSHCGWHDIGLAVTSLWSSRAWSLLCLRPAAGRATCTHWNSEPRLDF